MELNKDRDILEGKKKEASSILNSTQKLTKREAGFRGTSGEFLLIYKNIFKETI